MIIISIRFVEMMMMRIGCSYISISENLPRVREFSVVAPRAQGQSIFGGSTDGMVRRCSVQEISSHSLTFR